MGFLARMARCWLPINQHPLPLFQVTSSNFVISFLHLRVMVAAQPPLPLPNRQLRVARRGIPNPPSTGIPRRPGLVLCG